MIKNIKHVDEKVLTPQDTASISPADISKHYAKPVRGYAIISDMEGNVLETPNLVLLGGREFIAQKIADISSISSMPSSTDDLSKFKIRYFGVGTGGADTADTPNKIGPFDNDLDLIAPGKFADISYDTDDTPILSSRYQYIHDGKLKKIQSDNGGSIEILPENHNITINGEEIAVDAYTTIKYTMVINSQELYKESDENGPFSFNEAALYTVEYEDNVQSTNGNSYNIPATTDGSELSRYSARHRAFARFTTLTKWLEVKDSLKIEWFILV
ncbi:MAG: hypothetical protein DRG78_08380 [Epsilonproteobacteria bacterium]|nr:MAG: hypothetical protein DRG78_08380 [Campylobacterota bacterium]